MKRGYRCPLALVTLVILGCSSSETPGVSGLGETPEARERMRKHESLMRGMRLRQIDEGKLEVELEAREAWLARGGRLLHAKQVKATYYGEDGKPAVLKADQARYDLDRRRLKAWGRVRVEARDMTLETASLVWDGLAGKASGDSRVRVTKGGNVTTGTGFEWDPVEEKVAIEEVEANIRRPKELEPLVDVLEGQ